MQKVVEIITYCDLLWRENSKMMEFLELKSNFNLITYDLIILNLMADFEL